MSRNSVSDEQPELIRTLLILQLGIAGLPQRRIRAIGGYDIKRVNSVMKHVLPWTAKKPRGGGE